MYKRKLEPAKDIVSFLAFVSFFPQLVAGPIERATNLLPQFYKKRVFEYDKAVDGMRQILWGLFDNCAEYANIIFNNYIDYSGSTLVLGAIFFTFQIYCDFSGYSDMAIGMSRLFGFNLMRNFAFPYFSRDIAEFWRRWHISLSTWFRDYLYIPLGGSKGSLPRIIRNTFIIFLVSGFWHGANWTFIVWGFLNALYFLPLLLSKNNRKNLNIVAENRNLPTIKEFANILLTFSLTVFAWIFFRAETVSQAFSYINRIFTVELFKVPIITGGRNELLVIIITILFVIIEWMGRRNEYAIEKLFANNKKWIRWGFYYIILLVIFLMAGKEQEFIYFQF